MVDAINKIIRNTLLKSTDGVVLPDIGTLKIVARPASRISRKAIVPPHKTVEFSSSAEGSSIIDEILRFDVDAELAAEAYDVWRRSAYVDGVLTVAGVGSVKNGVVTPDKEFLQILNPQGTAPVVIKPRTDKFLYIFASFCCIFAICIAGYIFVNYRNADDRIKTPTTKRETPAVQPEEAAPSVENVQSLVAAEPETPTKLETPAEEPAAVPAYDKNEILYSTSGHSYLVLGIFSTEDNARRAIADAGRKYPAVDCRIYHYSDKFMVSLFEGRSAGECTAYKRSIENIFPDLWIYTKK